MIVRNSQGREFLVRVVSKGDRHGLDDCLVHDKDDQLVEFYDQTYVNKNGFGPRGQFVAAYCASTLANRRHPGAGLCLDGGVPEWNIDGPAFAPVTEMIRSLVKSCGQEATT